MIEILLAFSYISLIFFLTEFVFVGSTDFYGHYKKTAPKCFHFLFLRNKYAPEEIPLIAAVLKLIALLYNVVSIVSAIVIGVLLNEFALYILMGVLFGINLLFTIALAVVRTKFNKDDSLSRM